MRQIRIGIVGYGNLGKGVEVACKSNADMRLVGVFTRRDPLSVRPIAKDVGVYHMDALNAMTDEIDVLILCGGSATDLPEMTPALARNFNVVDSFDTHARIPEHFAAVDMAAKDGGTVAIISAGWDPGLFSLNRVMAEAILPSGTSYTFWGKGLALGHSEAIRKIEGVRDARQYTIPVEEALRAVREGLVPKLTTREKHRRVCYVALKDGADDADEKRVEREIVTMPYYFDEYDTEVHFISIEELKREHSGFPHGGSMLRSGTTGQNEENTQIIEYRLKLDSNPEFTSSVLVAYARACYRLFAEGQSGCRTVFDIAPGYLMNMSAAHMRATLL